MGPTPILQYEHLIQLYTGAITEELDTLCLRVRCETTSTFRRICTQPVNRQTTFTFSPNKVLLKAEVAISPDEEWINNLQETIQLKPVEKSSTLIPHLVKIFGRDKGGWLASSKHRPKWIGVRVDSDDQYSLIAFEVFRGAVQIPDLMAELERTLDLEYRV